MERAENLNQRTFARAGVMSVDPVQQGLNKIRHQQEELAP